jgi:hypothetical protein
VKITNLDNQRNTTLMLSLQFSETYNHKKGTGKAM